MADIGKIADCMRANGFGADLIYRVVRLNPHPVDGERFRGLHLAPTAHRQRFYRDEISKGEVIRKFGRLAWKRLPRHAIRKDGKRAYATRYAIEDKLWLRASA